MPSHRRPPLLDLWSWFVCLCSGVWSSLRSSVRRVVSPAAEKVILWQVWLWPVWWDRLPVREKYVSKPCWSVSIAHRRSHYWWSPDPLRQSFRSAPIVPGRAAAPPPGSCRVYASVVPPAPAAGHRWPRSCHIDYAILIPAAWSLRSQSLFAWRAWPGYRLPGGRRDG